MAISFHARILRLLKSLICEMRDLHQQALTNERAILHLLQATDLLLGLRPIDHLYTMNVFVKYLGRPLLLRKMA